jgi:hypothetical protein
MDLRHRSRPRRRRPRALHRRRPPGQAPHRPPRCARWKARGRPSPVRQVARMASAGWQFNEDARPHRRSLICSLPQRSTSQRAVFDDLPHAQHLRLDRVSAQRRDLEVEDAIPADLPQCGDAVLASRWCRAWARCAGRRGRRCHGRESRSAGRRTGGTPPPAAARRGSCARCRGRCRSCPAPTASTTECSSGMIAPKRLRPTAEVSLPCGVVGVLDRDREVVLGGDLAGAREAPRCARARPRGTPRAWRASRRRGAGRRSARRRARKVRSPAPSGRSPPRASRGQASPSPPRSGGPAGSGRPRASAVARGTASAVRSGLSRPRRTGAGGDQRQFAAAEACVGHVRRRTSGASAPEARSMHECAWLRRCTCALPPADSGGRLSAAQSFDGRRLVADAEDRLGDAGRLDALAAADLGLSSRSARSR